MIISGFRSLCVVCVSLLLLPGTSLDKSATSTMPPKFGGGEKCDICSKTVYAAERIEAGNRPFHLFCFKCSECKMQLKRDTYAQADGTLYCKKHYGQKVVAKNTQCPAAI